ncbi:MMPL family transporter [Burkholderia sp. Ac-20365]|uniref:hopanoid transporter HpnN n=1 Tax=Burkholderia sp. Ac-20365 TaxID=2703897 RepID=UPI00197B7B1C|nr:MMPL family transporter [Burkholderia sp. Ac-20365]MBN3761540.1 MMPL family transporter [Burkholderia sp. Ac-20365]
MTSVVSIVLWSMRHRISVMAFSLVLSILSGYYVVHHFKINTDTDRLLTVDKRWSALSSSMDHAFPQRGGSILVVVEADAPEFADTAATELADTLRKDTKQFVSVTLPTGGSFFEHNGLLFLPVHDVQSTTTQLVQARPLLNALAHDPSLTGLANLLTTTLLLPLQLGQVKLSEMAPLLERSATVLDRVQAGRPAVFSWRAVADHTLKLPARAFVLVQPVLDYASLRAGGSATEVIRSAASSLNLDSKFGARVRLTGEQPLADDEFASVQDGAAFNSIITFLVVLCILWGALRSFKLVLAVFITLVVGLLVTAAIGLMMVGAFNMISVAFMVLFVGLGVDFGVQFTVRYREQRFKDSRLLTALVNTAQTLGTRLRLAAIAVAVSFFSFIPTAYRGVSELGKIAGVGMVVAYLTSVTLLPALIRVFRPHEEKVSPGFRRLARVDDFLDRNRNPVLIVAACIIIGASPLLLHLRFDFNPLHLKDPHTESMATLLALKDSPEMGVNNVRVMADSLKDADTIAARLSKLPEVGRTVTLTTFIPGDQPEKLKLIASAAQVLQPILSQTPSPAVTDSVRVDALKRAANQLSLAADDHPGPGATEAKHLAQTLTRLASASSATRDRTDYAMTAPLKIALHQLAMLLDPAEITSTNLPPSIAKDWIAADGKSIVEISPKVLPGADPNDDAMLRRFAKAVRVAEPNAIGGPISILYSADLVIKAFLEASGYALVSIVVILWFALRRVDDILRTIVPLLVSAFLTLELSVALGLELNFANIIALPLMLGVGVAFKIYYVIAWRGGETRLLESSLTYAVVFSAGTTGAAFGSLWFSHHPGTSSLGALLALSLVSTLIGAVIFQPVLMGRPRVTQLKSTAQAG